MKYTMYSEKDNTLYIMTKILVPKCSNWEELKRAFCMKYEERLKKYCPSEIREQVENEIKLHAGCKISEFTDAY